MFGIMLVNSAVLVAWRMPQAWRFLNRYFLSVPGYPYALSVVGNVFSHQQPLHLATNMFVLWLMGTRCTSWQTVAVTHADLRTVHEDVGRGNFLAIYTASGVLASFFSLTSFVLRRNFVTSSLGASGAVAGVIAAYCCYNRE